MFDEDDELDYIEVEAVVIRISTPIQALVETVNGHQQRFIDLYPEISSRVKEGTRLVLQIDPSGSIIGWWPRRG